MRLRRRGLNATLIALGLFGPDLVRAQELEPVSPQRDRPFQLAQANPSARPSPSAVQAVKQTLTVAEPTALTNYLGKLNQQKSYAVVATSLLQAAAQRKSSPASL